MKDKGRTENISDEELVKLFNQTSSVDEKLQYFSKIQDDNCKMELLNSISEKERYKFIGKLKASESIATALKSLSDDKTKSKTFNFVAKQFKGNNIGLLEILTQIDFDVTIPPNMLTFKLENINALNLDFLINIQRHVINHSEMKFKINEHESDSTKIEYSFSEISAIIAKIEELTADIPKEMDEANKFYKVYSRVTGMMTYDYKCIRESDDAKNKANQSIGKTGFWKAQEQYDKEMKEIRKKPAGLYGGLIDGKAICAGYALILHEALKYVGLKSQYVIGFVPGSDGHAWNQVQIDGKWYNADPTWDSQEYQYYRRYEDMLLNDEDFNQTHGKFSRRRTKTEHKCKSRFDYSKIKGLLPSQIKSTGRREHAL
ncbi:MAG: transglutaminase domain-containing protein [Clostridia bacterium]